MQKRIWIAAIFGLMLLGAGCGKVGDAGMGGTQAPPMQATSSAMSVDPRAACAAEAKQFVADNLVETKGFGVETESWYNPRLEACFVKVVSYRASDDAEYIDVYGVADGLRYAAYAGHRDCPADGADKKCEADSGDIWLDGADYENTSDFHVGFSRYTAESAGDKDTRGRFLERVRALLED